MGRIGLLAVVVAVGLVCRAASAQNDMDCLKQFKESVRDPQGYLSGWNFGSPAPQICLFNGVTCLHLNDSKVYTLSLSGVGLSGSFPAGLSSCHSLTSLDLSDNGFTGPVPTNLCQMLPYLVTFNVRANSIAGTMSSSFNNCTYLNTLDVSHNKISGSIPGEVGLLARLTKFDVSFNQLSGPIPYTFSKMPASSFANNRGLCGRPLKECSSGKSRSRVALVAGVSAGGVVLGLAVAFIWLLPKVRPRKDPAAAAAAESKWAKRIKSPSSVTVSMFEKPLAKLRLADLMAATNDFSAENMIMSGRTGVIYKATLADGSVMAIRRLSRHSQQSEKEFKSEMETLGVLRHRNLVPLLGYCIADNERLLVYKHMSNGSLKDWLHGGQATQYSLDWSKRLKIAIGASRGLAWLHHSCNPRIIHRNISAASILLDEDFEAKITDFGLARRMNPVDTHISTFVNGDFGEVGYVAPEYARTLVATSRGDVYSLGVVLLELVTGQKPVDVQAGEQSFKGNLVEWVAVHNRNGSLAAVVQASLRATPDADGELLQVLKVALSCVAGAARERPSAYEVYQLLRAIGQKYHFSDQNEELPLVDSSSVVLDVEQQGDPGS